MTLEAHQALINLLLTPEKGAEFKAGKTREL